MRHLIHRAARSHLALAALLVITTLTALTGGRRDAFAAPLADEEFVGVTSDLAVFKLGIPKGGDRIAYVEISEPANAYPFPCFGAATLTFEAAAFERGALVAPETPVTDPATGEARVLRIRGRMFRDGIVVGDLSISGDPNAEGIICSPRSFSWAAVARLSADAPVAGTPYTGTLLAGQTYAGLADNAGTVSLRTAEDGNAITGYVLQPEQSCAATDLGTLRSALKAGNTSITELRPRSDTVAQARHRVALFGRSGVGAFYIDHDKAGCRPLAGIFVLSAASAPTVTPAAPPPAATPAAPAVVAPSGTFASPPVFPATGARLAQVVFRGGTLDQLGTALAGVNATGAWAQGADGTYLLYVVGAPAFVNERFLRAFPAGFASTTALTVVAQQPTFGRAE